MLKNILYALSILLCFACQSSDNDNPARPGDDVEDIDGIAQGSIDIAKTEEVNFQLNGIEFRAAPGAFDRNGQLDFELGTNDDLFEKLSLKFVSLTGGHESIKMNTALSVDLDLDLVSEKYNQIIVTYSSKTPQESSFAQIIQRDLPVSSLQTIKIMSLPADITFAFIDQGGHAIGEQSAGNNDDPKENTKVASENGVLNKQEISGSGKAGNTGEVSTGSKFKAVPTIIPNEIREDSPIVSPLEDFSEWPTEEPTAEPSESPLEDFSEWPTEEPTAGPSESPLEDFSEWPTEEPTAEPSESPLEDFSEWPTEEPTAEPSESPLEDFSVWPTEEPTAETSESPLEDFSEWATEEPTADPSQLPDPILSKNYSSRELMFIGVYLHFFHQE